MQPGTILVVCLGACVVAVVAFIAHRRLAGTAERAGLLSMLAYVLGVLAVITAVITGGFLLSIR
ncbi:MAG: hypothetical protein JO352_08380 [Chloroflexi bacterium]|nr:hypothetical protein [Chloroflexota bacterium]MBV9602958.1 hypothetical protein [Chloroflexota bacterium]